MLAYIWEQFLNGSTQNIFKLIIKSVYFFAITSQSMYSLFPEIESFAFIREIKI